MTHNTGNCIVTHRNRVSQDAQGRWRETVSPTEVPTGEASKIIQKKTRRHGNRKLQHSERKCRAHAMAA